MVVYNVPERLARAVVFGQKCYVLKPHGNRAHAAVGQMMHIETGFGPPAYSRSDGYCRLMVAPCVLSLPVRIEETRFLRACEVDTQGHRLELLAHDEGFETYAALRADIAQRHGLPWEGQLLRWNPAEAEFRAQWPLLTRMADEMEEEG